MKNLSSRMISAAALSIIILCLLGGFSHLNPQHGAKALLNQRMSLLQDALQGRISKQVAEKRLRQIEDEALLVQDLALLKELDQEIAGLKGQKQKEEARALLEESAYLGKVGKVRQKKKYYQYITYEAELFPVRQNQKKHEHGEVAVLCNLVVKEEGRDLYLTVFQPEER